MAAPHVNQTTVVRARPDEVRRELLAVAGAGSYRLAGETHDGFALRRRRIPGWAIAVAVLLPIPGILALFVRRDEIVTVAIASSPEGTRVSITGQASVALQQALQGALGRWQIAGAPAPRGVEAGLPAPPPPGSGTTPPGGGALPPPPPPGSGTVPPPAPGARQATPGESEAAITAPQRQAALHAQRAAPPRTRAAVGTAADDARRAAAIAAGRLPAQPS